MSEQDAVTWYRAAQQAQKDRAALRAPKKRSPGRVLVAYGINRKIKRTLKKLGIELPKEDDDE